MAAVADRLVLVQFTWDWIGEDGLVFGDTVGCRKDDSHYHGSRGCSLRSLAACSLTGRCIGLRASFDGLDGTQTT